MFRSPLLLLLLLVSLGLAGCEGELVSPAAQGTTSIAAPPPEAQVESATLLVVGLDGARYEARGAGQAAQVAELAPGTAERIILDLSAHLGDAAKGAAFTSGALGGDGKLYFAALAAPARSAGRPGWLLSYDPRTGVAETVGIPAPAAPDAPAAEHARRYLRAVEAALDQTEAALPQFAQVADIVADRHLRGGLIDFLGGGILHPELSGRSGGIMHVGFHAPRKDQAEDGKAHDVYLVGCDRAGSDLPGQMRAARERGAYLVGFGPRHKSELAEHVALCDAWFDSGGGEAALFAQAMHGWVFTAELVAALTRRGKMPTMWMSYGLPEGVAWGEIYRAKHLFHDDFTVPPQPAGHLGRETLRMARYHLRSFGNTQLAAVARVGELIAEEARAGRKTVVALTGHMPQEYVGFYDDAAWAHNRELHAFVDYQVSGWKKDIPRGALVLVLGYTGLPRNQMLLHREMQQRTIVITGDHPSPEHRSYDDAVAFIDNRVAWGDATVSVPGYPIRIVPATGYMQLAAYQAVGAEVQARLAADPPAQPAVLAPASAAAAE